MLIISKFRDYYDTGMNHGVDKTIRYYREFAEAPWDDKAVEADWTNRVTTFYRGTRDDSTKYTFIPGHLGFCGRIFPLYSVGYMDMGKSINGVQIIQPKSLLETFYHIDPLMEFIVKHRIILDRGKADWESHDIFLRIIKFLRGEICVQKDGMFLKHRVPIFITGRNMDGRPDEKKVMLNTCLKEHQFFKVKDPISAYQEISMYISGVLGQPNNPIVQTSDQVRAESHGHGDKYSFRKPPGTKKGKPEWR